MYALCGKLTPKCSLYSAPSSSPAITAAATAAAAAPSPNAAPEVSVAKQSRAYAETMDGWQCALIACWLLYLCTTGSCLQLQPAPTQLLQPHHPPLLRMKHTLNP